MQAASPRFEEGDPDRQIFGQAHEGDLQGQLASSGGNYYVNTTITVNDNPSISPVNADGDKDVSGLQYTSQTAYKNVGAQTIKVQVPSATFGYTSTSIDPGDTKTIGAGAAGHVILEYDGESRANDWCGVLVVNTRVIGG
jgi:hypothetical protein